MTRFFLMIILILFSCQESNKTDLVYEEIDGCTDNEAINYNPIATIDNQECVYSGCMDPEAANYDESATIDDGDCLTNDKIPEGYELFWNDEFNSDTLNLKYWNIELWWPGAFNNELQSYTQHQNNITLQNGYLYLRAQKDMPFNPNNPGYTSGRITTKNKVELQYGFWEVRAKLPSGNGTWPAIWMLNSIIDSIGWPYSGEIDIMEHVGYDPNRVFFSLHNENLYANVYGSDQQSIYDDDQLENQFHTYAIEWDSTNIKGFFDGIEYFDYDKPLGSSYSSWPYDSPFFLILNLAIGGDWGGVQGVDNSIFPASFVIDYARMFKKEL